MTAVIRPGHQQSAGVLREGDELLRDGGSDLSPAIIPLPIVDRRLDLAPSSSQPPRQPLRTDGRRL
jgi:hypothetical protein